MDEILATGRGFMSAGAVTTRWHEYRRGWKDIDAGVIEEASLTIYVNGAELVTIMSTPREQDLLALGFLKNEGFIDNLKEVDHIHISEEGRCVDIWLTHTIVQPKRKIITTGCGGGVTFKESLAGFEALQDGLRITPEVLFEIFRQLHNPDSLHARTRGVHAAGITDGKRLLAITEDVGRHNTIDKLVGASMVKGIDTRGLILLATGRISSEMLHKGARMGCPIIASRNSPTSIAIAMADAWNITLIGYVRRGSMRVYTHPERLGYRQPTALPIADNLLKAAGL
jgi:FdhD protein